MVINFFFRYAHSFFTNYNCQLGIVNKWLRMVVFGVDYKFVRSYHNTAHLKKDAWTIRLLGIGQFSMCDICITNTYNLCVWNYGCF